LSEETNKYGKIILLHLIAGVLIFVMPFIAKLYAIAIILVGFNYIIKNKNQNNEALLVAAYIVGAEVFLRMTQGNFFEQYAKLF